MLMEILFLYHELSSWAVLFPQQDMIFTKKKKKEFEENAQFQAQWIVLGKKS